MADIEDFKPLIEILQKKPLPIYYERKNSGVGRSLPFGIINRRNFGLGRSRTNKMYPTVYSELLRLGDKYAKDIKWTSIMLNQNYTTLPHKDKGNDGNSIIIGFGDYTDGKLCLQHDEENIEKIDIHYKPFTMDASKTVHFTEPFSGTRYSIVFFRVRLVKKLKDKYKDYGFRDLDALLGEYDDADCHHKIT